MKEEQIYTNNRFLDRINPKRTILYAFGVWSVLFFTAPLVIRIDVNLMSYVFILLALLSFFLGGTLRKKSSSKLKIVPINEKKLKQLFNIVLFLALVGLLTKLIDRFFIRGITIESDFLENRDIMEQAGGNPIAIVASFLVPFGLIPLFMFWRYQVKLSFFLRVVVFVVFFAQFFDALLIGARSTIFVTIVFFALFVFYFKKIKLTLRKTILLISLAITFLLFMNYIFLERTKLFAGDKAFEIVLSQSNFNYTLTSSQEFKQKFNTLDPVTQTATFTYITTTQYFTHGMIEFSYLFDNFEKDHSFGKYSFNTYFRFLSKLVGEELDMKELQNLTPRPGVYTTFFGPIFIDFGWFTLLFMFFFGRLTYFIFNRAKQGADWAIIMYFFLFIVLMFSPVFNFINGAGGIFIFTSIILFQIFANKFYHEKVN